MANHIRAWHYFRPPGESQALQRIPEKPMALSQSAVTLTDISSAQKNWVFAHFMVGNTYPYNVGDWTEDIKLAASQDLDGFVLNVGPESWQQARVADCFTAASQLPESTNFRFFFSFDMSSIPGTTVQDVQLLKAYYAPFAKNPRLFKHPRTGGVVVSTFSGENSTFGQGTMENGWAYVKATLGAIAPVYFVPSLFINPARYPSIAALDGAFNWNGGWPIELTPTHPRDQIVNAKLESDVVHIRNLTGGRTFMAAVSPWFFTHYGPDSWNKNWIYRGDDWLFVRRWEQLIAMRDHVDIAQVISWNEMLNPALSIQDYGESHYIGPIKGAQPNSQAWVDGYPHEAWLRLNSYFARAFKKGTYPTITKDEIYLWGRPHPKAAGSADHVGRPNNWELTDDLLWAVVFATAPATVDLYTTETRKHTFSVVPGMTKLSCPLKADGGMRATMIRDGEVVVSCSPVGYRFESRPGVYNFNVVVAASA